MKLEPVRVLYIVAAALEALLGVGHLTDYISDAAVFWLSTALAILTAVGGEIARSRVTPLARPRDRDGSRLVPMRYERGHGAVR